MLTLIALGLGANAYTLLTLGVLDTMTFVAGFLIGAYKRSKK